LTAPRRHRSNPHKIEGSDCLLTEEHAFSGQLPVGVKWPQARKQNTPEAVPVSGPENRGLASAGALPRPKPRWPCTAEGKDCQGGVRVTHINRVKGWPQARCREPGTVDLGSAVALIDGGHARPSLLKEERRQQWCAVHPSYTLPTPTPSLATRRRGRNITDGPA
jgi:hypothetical protein